MTRNHIAAWVAVGVCTILPFVGQFYGDRQAGWLMVDFRAYYCAASAVGHHANPYFAASVHACESRPISPYYRAPANVTVPVPYPPYVLMALYPLTLLPFGVAAILWWTILVLCLLVAAYALARVTRQPFLVAWAVLVLSLGLTSFSSGNMVTVCVAALLVASLCAQLGDLPATALAITAAMVEPQLALPAAVAAFVRFPSLRIVLVLLAALLAVGSLVASGLTRNLLYLTSVLPAHALSEVSRDNQYSLATILSALGVPDTQAVIVGTASYIVVSIIGIVVALRLARDYLDPAFALLLPPAFALLGGSFVHTGEIAVAAPACLLLFSRTEGRRRMLLAVLVLLSVPWMLATSAASFLAPLFPVGYLVYVLGGRDWKVAGAAGLASIIVIGCLFALALHPAPHVVSQTIVRPPIDPRLGEAGWRTFVLGNSTNRLVMWLLRLPTWIGLVAFAFCALLLARKPRTEALLGGVRS